jgi:hypothetical protein
MIDKDCPSWLLDLKASWGMPEVIPLDKAVEVYGWTEITGGAFPVSEGDAMSKSFENATDIQPFSELHGWRSHDGSVKEGQLINSWGSSSGVRHFRHIDSPWWHKTLAAQPKPRPQLPGNPYFREPLPLP